MSEQFTFPEKNELTTSEYQDKRLDEVYLGQKEGRFILENSKSGAQLSDGSFYAEVGNGENFLLKIENGLIYEETYKGKELSENFKIKGKKIIYGNGEKFKQKDNLELNKEKKFLVNNKTSDFFIKNCTEYLDSSEIKKIPKDVLNDKSFILDYFEKIKGTGLLTELYFELSNENKKDPEIILSAIVSNSIYNVSSIPKEIQENMPFDIGLEFVKKHGLNIKFLPKKLQENFDIVIEAINENSRSYDYLTEKMKKLLKSYKDEFKGDEKKHTYI